MHFGFSSPGFVFAFRHLVQGAISVPCLEISEARCLRLRDLEEDIATQKYWRQCGDTPSFIKLQGPELSRKGDSVMSTPSAFQLSNDDWCSKRTSQGISRAEAGT
jgi:hypothetical protein